MLLITEILFSFLVMFAVFTLVVYYYQNYRREMGFEYEPIWVISYNNNFEEKAQAGMNAAYFDRINQMLKGMPQIESFSYASNNTPFSMSTNNGDATYGKVSESANRYSVDDNYSQVTKVEIIQGRWFTESDAVGKYRPLIINETLKEKLFGNENPIGKIVGAEEDKKSQEKVIGVIKDFKDKGDFQGYENGMFKRLDTSSYRWISRIMVRVRPDADAAFEARLHKQLSGLLKNFNVEIEHLTEKRVTKNNITLVPMIILLVVASFLIFNVALGLFGVLWYNINKRKGEIGLRRAVGASGQSILQQIVGETFVLATFAMAIGSFFAVQFPLLHVFDLAADTYIIALILAVAFIYGLVVICSLYPGRQAAAIYPAVALHED